MSTPGGFVVRNRGESCWFTRFHLDSAEVYCPSEIALNDWFQQVPGTHGCPTSRQDQICVIETLLNLGDVILDTEKGSKKMRNADEIFANGWNTNLSDTMPKSSTR